MPSTIVHAGFAMLIAAALLGNDADRRALAVVLVAVVLPELDSIAGLYLTGAHRALGHNLVFPAAIGALCYYDTRRRDESWIAARWGDRGVRVVWVCLLVHVYAHVLLDYAHLDGINPFYPLYDRFYRLEGEAYLSTAEGFVQTFVETDPETGEVGVGAGGTTDDTHVSTPVQPDADPDPDEPVDRRFPVAVHGWQLYLLLVGLFALAARRLQGPEPDPTGEE